MFAWMFNDGSARPTGNWVLSVLGCAARSPSKGFALAPRAVETGPQLDKARNLLLKAFLESDYPYLLFCDTDIVFSEWEVKLLLDAQEPIAGALYYTAASTEQPSPTALVEEDGNYVPLTLPEPPQGEDEMAEFIAAAAAPIEVAAVGMGLTLISRECAEAVSAYHDRPFEYANGNSEDLTFCLRAAMCGFRSVVVPLARVGHVKAQVL